MKALVLLVLAVVSYKVSETKVYDLSKIKPKLPPAYDPYYLPKRYPSPPLRAANKDFRAVCGTSNPPASRIVGGWEAGVHEFPWQVALWINDEYFCGGSLISDQWVLTAAHCADGTLNYNVWLGAHNIVQAESFRLEIPVATDAENNFIHPDWNPNTLKDDIALIKLPSPVTLSDNISPICLPPANEAEQHVGEIEILSGWGRTQSGSSISPVLRKTNATVISNTQCRQMYGSIITANHICIGTEDDHGTCSVGDSGGPLSHVGADGAFTQIGVFSFGAEVGCEAGYPAGFSRVSNYVEWISATTGIVF